MYLSFLQFQRFIDTTNVQDTSEISLHIRDLFVVLLTIGIAVFGVGCNGVKTVTCDGMGNRSGDKCLGFADVSTSPTVDATIGEDEGWGPGFRYVFEQGTSTSMKDVVVQGVEANNEIYVSFKIDNDPEAKTTDQIWLYFDPDGTEKKRKKIEITPFPVVNNTPSQIEYSSNGVDTGSKWDWKNSPSSPGWINDIKVENTSQGVNDKQWYVEMRLDESSLEIPSNDDFGFYMVVRNTHSVSGLSNPKTVYNTWPPNTSLRGQVFKYAPPVSEWGNGAVGRVANGVSIQTSDISVSPGADDEISLNQSNTFKADVKNHMVDQNGASMEASSVNATFEFAPWGLPGSNSWTTVPAANNPTSSKDVPRGNPGSEVFTSTWTLSSAEQNKYSNNREQCLRVELDSQGSNTLITNRRAKRNMRFVNTNSPFEAEAQLGTEGYELPEGSDVHKFVLHLFYRGTPNESQWESELESSANVERLGDNSFLVRVQPDTSARLRKVIDPPVVEIPRQVVNLGTSAQETAQIPVEPGNIITFYNTGNVVLRPGADGVLGRTAGPNGVEFPGRAGPEAPAQDTITEGGQNTGGAPETGGVIRAPTAEVEAEVDFRLADNYAPWSRVGAVMGSFDGFDTSAFPIGKTSTIKVPEGAENLTLGLNIPRGAESKLGGDGFRLEVMQTPPKEHFASIDGRVLQENDEVVFLPTGINLPQVNVKAHRLTGRTVTLEDDQEYEVVEKVGSYGYYIKKIGN